MIDNKQNTSSILDIPKELKEELLREGNNVVVFFGNGISRLAGVISWEELGTELLNILLNKEEKITYENYIYLKSKNTIEQISIFTEKIKSIYPNNYKNKIVYYLKDLLKPKKEQDFKELYECLSNLHASEYITTNYLTGFDKKLNLTIRYLHGCLDDVRNIDKCYEELVLTLSQYLQKYKKGSDINEFLSNIFSEKTVLFVGLGLQEYEIIQHLVPPPPNKQNHHYLLKPFFYGEEALIEEYKEMYRNLSINIEDYNISEIGYGVLKNILKEWSTIIKKEREKINLELKNKKEILDKIVIK